MSDEDTTKQMPADEGPEPQPTHDETAETAARPEGAPGPKRLFRSRDDRMLSGVAGGLGRYFSVDPVIIRIAFAVATFAGGLGIIAYIALALFVPADPEGGEEPVSAVERSRWLALAVGAVIAVAAFSAAGSLFFWDSGWGGGPFGLLFLIAIGAGAYALLRDREPGQGSSAGRRIMAGAIAVGAAIGLIVLAFTSAFVAATGSGTVIAALVIAAGLLLIVGAVRGGARWLIAPALALAVPLGVVSAADISFAGGVGERHYRPATATAVPDRYEFGVGELVVDLRDIDWTEAATSIPLELDLGVGEAVVLVPEEVCVSSELHVGAGEIVSGAGRIEGFDIDEFRPDGVAPRPSLILDAEVDLGSLRVLNEYDPGGRHGPPFEHRGEETRADAC